MIKYLLLIFIILNLSSGSYAQGTIDGNGNTAHNKPSSIFPKLTREQSSAALNVIHDIPSVSSNPCDIAFDGVDLWLSGYDDYFLYKISRIDGSVIRKIPTTVQRPYGLEYANGYLWIVDTDHHIIQKIDPANGTVISSFPTPAKSSNSYPTGLAWDGQNLWNNDVMGYNSNLYDSTYNITNTGSRLAVYHGYGQYCSGLAWDGHYLWSTDNTLLEIHKIDLATFTVIETIDAPGGIYPNGLAFDGQYLWVANNGRDRLYQIDIGYTATTAIIDSPGNGSAFYVYPNPATDEIRITLPSSGVGMTYSITDQLGKQVLTGEIKSETTIFNIKQLESGIYFFHVQNGKPSIKIIKR